MKHQRRHRPTARGHVYQRGRLWWISVYVGGRRHQESSRSTRRSDAVRLLAERVAYLAPRPDSSASRLADMLGALVTWYEINGRRSARQLRVSIGHLKAGLGDPMVRELDEARIFDYAAARVRSGAGTGTVNLELGALRRAFRLAHDLKRVREVPKIRLLKPPAPRSGFVERPQLEAIARALPPWAAAPVRAAYCTGWRMASEILTRRPSHVDLQGGWLRLDAGEGKTGTGREFPLTDELRAIFAGQVTLADAFERRTGRRPSHMFFDPVTGRRIASIRAAWRVATQTAGCPGLRPHDLRRSAVRNLERAGVPRSTAMRLVGHKTESMYTRYAIQDAATLRDAARKLDNLQRSADSNTGTGQGDQHQEPRIDGAPSGSLIPPGQGAPAESFRESVDGGQA